MNCQCGECPSCRGEKKPLFPRAAWSDPGRLKQRIEQAEASVMAEERQAQASFKWARVGFSVALTVQVGLSAGCFLVKPVYGGPPIGMPSPQSQGPGVPPASTGTPLATRTPEANLTPVEKKPNDVHALPPRTQIAQPLRPKPTIPEGRLTPGEDPPRKVYGMPRRGPK